MKNVPQRPLPLVELPREQDPVQVGLLIRSARSAPVEDTPGVTWRIRNTLHRRTERRARVLRFAVVGAVIFVAGGVVGAVMQRTRAPWSEPSLAPASQPEPSGRRRTTRARPVPETSVLPETQDSTAAESPSKDEMPVASPAPALPVLATRNKPKPAPIRLAARPPTAETVPQSQPVPPPAPPSVPAPTPTAAEQALLSSALGKLRVSHEPTAALALLDEYRSRFPGGMLAAEAARLRREALLLLGRKATVLDELEQAGSVDATTGDERVLRGELRASAGRWQAAFADFDAVVRAQPSAAEISDRRVRDRLERALWGRASARSHQGDDDGVCADLGEYFRRFPHGRFAAQAKQLLDKECEP